MRNLVPRGEELAAAPFLVARPRERGGHLGRVEPRLGALVGKTPERATETGQAPTARAGRRTLGDPAQEHPAQGLVGLTLGPAGAMQNALAEPVESQHGSTHDRTRAATQLALERVGRRPVGRDQHRSPARLQRLEETDRDHADLAAARGPYDEAKTHPESLRACERTRRGARGGWIVLRAGRRSAATPGDQRPALRRPDSPLARPVGASQGRCPRLGQASSLTFDTATAPARSTRPGHPRGFLDRLLGRVRGALFRTMGAMAWEGMIDVGGGSLWVQEEGDGEAVVLLHAGICDARMWDDQWPDLTRSRRVLRLEMRGFGRSDMPADRSRITSTSRP